MPQTSRMPPLRRTLGGGIERGRRARGSPCICGAWRGFLRRCILPRQEREALRPAGIPAKRAEQHNIMQISRPRERTRQLLERPAITAERVCFPLGKRFHTDRLSSEGGDPWQRRRSGLIG